MGSEMCIRDRTIVDAQANAEQRRILAEGEAAAIFAKLDAEARGQYEILAKKGQGIREVIAACGSADEAFKMLMLEHIDHISETAAQAISNIKFDKIVVWDGGQGGKSSTANFLQNLAGSLPPALSMMKDIGGVEMPEYFGRLLEDTADPVEAGESAGSESGAEGEDAQGAS